jgi:hypothetical protein
MAKRVVRESESCRWSAGGVPASSLAPTLHGGKPRSLRREGIVWPGIHHSLDKRNSKRAAPCRPRPSHAGHWTATYSCSLQSSTPKDHSQRYTCPCICTVATLVCFLAHHASSQVTWPERVAVAVALPESEFRATRETARLEFHSKSATSKNSNHVSTLPYCDRRIDSAFPKPPRV